MPALRKEKGTGYRFTWSRSLFPGVRKEDSKKAKKAPHSPPDAWTLSPSLSPLNSGTSQTASNPRCSPVQPCPPERYTHSFRIQIKDQLSHNARLSAFDMVGSQENYGMNEPINKE